MTSSRHKSAEAAGVALPLGASSSPSTADAYLSAAREALLDLGWSRTTLTEIARRAGVSRMTLYRAWPDMNALLGDLMTREWADVLRISDAADLRVRIVESVIGSIQALRRNDVFSRIIELDAERLLPYLIERTGRVQDSLIGFLSEGIRAGQADHQVRSGDPALIASAVLLQAQGFALSAHLLAPSEERLRALDAEFTEALMRYLAP